MWFSDLKKALEAVTDRCKYCCITKIQPRADGGINFYLSDFSVVVWHKDGTITEYKEGDWRK